MCKELASLKTEDISKNFRVLGSKEVAEKFKKKHKNVLQTIEKLMAENKAVKNMFELNSYISERGREEKEYKMNRDGFSLLAMGFTGKEALEWKIKYINFFNLMENELKARIETRHIGVAVRKSLTDTIKNCVTDESNFKKFSFSTYTKLVYKKVLGKDVKKSKLERGLKETDNIRNFLTIEELEKVQDLESKIATYIEFTDNNGKTDKEIYQQVKEYIENKTN